MTQSTAIREKSSQRTSAGKSRKTQSERSAATRRTLLDAAIRCLFEHGYGMTTTILVAEEAGVSRGAMLHQFPSKADLMTFVVEAVFEEEVALYGELLRGIEKSERLLAYPAAVWKMMSRPAGVAVIEIFQGSRSDDVLAAKLKPVQDKIDRTAIAALRKEFHREPSIPLAQLIVAVGRGLAITNVISQASDDGGDAIRLFEELIRVGIESGTLFPKAETDTAS